MKEFLIENASNERKNQFRCNSEDLLKRANLLKGPDKLLIEMHLKDGYTLSELSSLAGVSQSTISRRIKKVFNRLHDPKISVFVDNRHRFEPQERKIIADYLREGMSQRQISKKRGTTRYRVRRAIHKLSTIG